MTPEDKIARDELFARMDKWGPLRGDHATRDDCWLLRRMLAEIEAERDQQQAEVARLNTWADGFSDAQLKERRLCEERIHEIEAERDALRRDLAACEQAGVKLREKLEAARDGLHLFASYGCPHCNGDCSAANPPVIDCPMKRLAEFDAIDQQQEVK